MVGDMPPYTREAQFVVWCRRKDIGQHSKCALGQCEGVRPIKTLLFQAVEKWGKRHLRLARTELLSKAFHYDKHKIRGLAVGGLIEQTAQDIRVVVQTQKRIMDIDISEIGEAALICHGISQNVFVISRKVLRLILLAILRKIVYGICQLIHRQAVVAMRFIRPFIGNQRFVIKANHKQNRNDEIRDSQPTADVHLPIPITNQKRI